MKITQHKRVRSKQHNTHRQDRQSLVQSPFMTFGQEMERVYSYNPGARMGDCHCTPIFVNLFVRQCHQCGPCFET